MPRPRLGPTKSARRRGDQRSAKAYVYETLREEIIWSDLPPGTALSENELAARYGVSRTPIREALIRLMDEELVEVIPQLGTFVSRISVRDVREMQFVRETLEVSSLPDTARHMSEADHTRLRLLLDDQARSGERGDLKTWFRTDEQFHRTLLEIAGRPRVWSVVNAAKAHLDRVRRLSLPHAEGLQALHEQHRAILANVHAGNVDEALDVLRNHLRLALGSLEALAATHPDYIQEDEERHVPGTRSAPAG